MARSHFHSIERTKHCVEVSEDEEGKVKERERERVDRSTGRAQRRLKSAWRTDGRTGGRTVAWMNGRTDVRATSTAAADGGGKYRQRWR